ncbi:transglutaminase TgpA family protein [Bacillus marinisedimentorum]|uniref:transglutaminase TgpA family protein n=1 Tax=Bacillus marinisedimentorum TaxID=1821260 RepID=UPI000872647B|nr:transglutaminaseTgpA domain-containing protein [Bacillus marinisedimentorum]
MNLYNPRYLNWLNAVLYGLGFLLFLEWLRPLETVTDTGDLTVFVMFAAFSFFVSFLHVNMLVSLLLKGTVMFYLLNSLFLEEAFLRFTWIPIVINDFIYNIGLISEAHWWEMTNLFRSLLFFVLLWLMGYLMFYWVVQVKRIFIFILFTIIYLTVLDTFTEYDATFAIVRTVIFSFLLMGILYFNRIKEKEGFAMPIGQVLMFWMVPLVSVILLAVLGGFTAPKAAPQWSDPVPFLKSATNQGGGGSGSYTGISKVGYGADDSQLGGPFFGDETPVFSAEVEDVHYWRVETKDVYTGKGWEVSQEAEGVPVNPSQIELNTVAEGVNTEELETTITMADNAKYPHLIYPVDLKGVQLPDGTSLLKNPITEKFTTLRNGENTILRSYSMTYDFPEFPIEKLMEPEQNVSPDIREAYTQLPEELPGRVRELAEEITAGKESSYEKAKAIEEYFTDEGYIYETLDVAVPDENEDYVDQFLFETKKGYCDNFSTSMVVLLRAVDIPTRWVKGYTQGEYIETPESGVRIYEIRNANAHSWVEAYFPEVGWVPFEPTRGFRNPFDFQAMPNETETETELPEEQPEEVEPDEALEQDTDNGGGGSVNFDFVWKAAAIAAGILAAVAFILYKTRDKWGTALLLYRFRRREDERAYFEAYQKLLKRLERKKGLRFREGQTLSEFARHVDKTLGLHEMEALTRDYERVLYRHEDASAGWKKSYELWENLIRRLAS